MPVMMKNWAAAETRKPGRPHIIFEFSKELKQMFLSGQENTTSTSQVASLQHTHKIW
jgi:hypothetical protein